MSPLLLLNHRIIKFELLCQQYPWIPSKADIRCVLFHLGVDLALVEDEYDRENDDTTLLDLCNHSNQPYNFSLLSTASRVFEIFSILFEKQRVVRSVETKWYVMKCRLSIKFAMTFFLYLGFYPATFSYHYCICYEC